MPSNFPVYDGAGIEEQTTRDGATAFGWGFKTADDGKMVVDWYSGKLKQAGWTMTAATSTQQTKDMVTWKVEGTKDGGSSYVVITCAGDADGTQVMVIASFEQ